MARKKTGNGEQGAGISGGAGGAQAPNEPSTAAAATITRPSTVASSNLPISPPSSDPCTMISIEVPTRRIDHVPAHREVHGRMSAEEAEICRDIFDGMASTLGRQPKTTFDVFRHLLTLARQSHRAARPELSTESRFR